MALWGWTVEQTDEPTDNAFYLKVRDKNLNAIVKPDVKTEVPTTEIPLMDENTEYMSASLDQCVTLCPSVRLFVRLSVRPCVSPRSLCVSHCMRRYHIMDHDSCVFDHDCHVYDYDSHVYNHDSHVHDQDSHV